MLLGPAKHKELLQTWRKAWPQALAQWSQFTKLTNPLLCQSTVEARNEGLSNSFAMIRLNDQSVVVNLESINATGLQDYALEILAHEIGHHVLAPATISDHFRLIARVRKELPTLEEKAAMVANLYTDLLINDRLQRQNNLRMHEIYIKLNTSEPVLSKPGVWALYMRTYEQLWKLDRGTLGVNVNDTHFENYAWLGARIVRVYANDWLTGGARFAALLLPYLHEQKLENDARLEKLLDTWHAGQNCEPAGLTELEAEELKDSIHPFEDPLLNDTIDKSPSANESTSGEGEFYEGDAGTNENTVSDGGQRRELFEYGEILRSAGMTISDHEVAIRYYRTAALPYLVPFPKKTTPQSTELQMEGLDVWEIGDALDDIDWLESLSQSPQVVPGVSTMKRHYGSVPRSEPTATPVDLDIYVDSSGSMPNPQLRISYMALAGAIICLSALRSGSRVKATLWSGKNQYMSTAGFVRDENALLSILTSHYGGATAFPIHALRDTFTERTDQDRACHILHISDSGIDTLFNTDERDNSGWDIAASALNKGRAGGTMALNLHTDWRNERIGQLAFLRRAHREQGWQIHAVTNLAELIEFSSNFSHSHYGART